MIIVTDIDECVLSWADAFYEWVVAHKGLNVENKWREHNRVEEWLIDYDGGKLVEEFNQSGEFSLLKPTAKADIFLPILYSMGHEFIALTACGTSDVTQEMRIRNLDEVFPGIFSRFIAVDSGVDKEAYLKEIKGDLWVEDNFRNATYGPPNGYTTFIIDYYHNQSDTDIGAYRVNDWEDVYNQVINGSL